MFHDETCPFQENAKPYGCELRYVIRRLGTHPVRSERSCVIAIKVGDLQDETPVLHEDRPRMSEQLEWIIDVLQNVPHAHRIHAEVRERRTPTGKITRVSKHSRISGSIGGPCRRLDTIGRIPSCLSLNEKLAGGTTNL